MPTIQKSKAPPALLILDPAVLKLFLEPSLTRGSCICEGHLVEKRRWDVCERACWNQTHSLGLIYYCNRSKLQQGGCFTDACHKPVFLPFLRKMDWWGGFNCLVSCITPSPLHGTTSWIPDCVSYDQDFCKQVSPWTLLTVLCICELYTGPLGPAVKVKRHEIKSDPTPLGFEGTSIGVMHGVLPRAPLVSSVDCPSLHSH